ncbi:hypothetical protein J3R30DRAFT_3774095 [Lentinula aciculospora]|uniref:Uncharacterized protein n=1 Tax=Lentinula aciculospora TaxID=153920 RepID=A0A9W9A6P5_9AGAR|nr:hypothetical protein J3R30DRAFT_3774095 [Lentinula aciculospora]
MCLPQTGSFVALRLDPMTMVENLRNLNLTAACRDLKLGTYVAYISQLDQVVSPFPSPHVSAALHFVFQGIPPNEFDWIEGIQQDMSIPILPNARHPFRRTPLNPGVPLPWKNCYISPLVVAWAKAVPVLIDPTHIATPQEQKRIRSVMDADVNSWNTMGRGKHMAAPAPQRALRRSPRRRLRSDVGGYRNAKHSAKLADHSQEESDAESFHTAQSSQSGVDSTSSLLEYVSSSAQRFGDDVDILRSLAVAIGQQKAALEPIVNLSSDLSLVNGILSPQKYLNELDLILRLIYHFEVAEIRRPFWRADYVQEASPTTPIANHKSWFARTFLTWQGRRTRCMNMVLASVVTLTAMIRYALKSVYNTNDQEERKA